MGGSPKTTTQTSNTAPWTGQQPALSEGLSQAQNLYDTGKLAPQYYSGQTVASQSPYTLASQGMIAARALGGSPVNKAASGLLTDTLNGIYLDPSTNPGFKQALDDTRKAYATGTAAQTDAAFNRSGAYGGSAYDETKQMQNKAYGDSLNTLAGNMYQQGRTNQMQGLLFAPQMANQDYTDAQQLAGVGANQEAYNQDLINQNIAKYNYNAQLPFNSLQDYMGLINGNYGKSSTLTQPLYSNRSGGVLGGALTGAAAGSTFGPWGTALGGGLGLLGGLF